MTSAGLRWPSSTRLCSPACCSVPEMCRTAGRRPWPRIWAIHPRRAIGRWPTLRRQLMSWPGCLTGRRQPGRSAVPTCCERRANQRYATAVVTAIVLIKADVARIPETAEAIAQIPAVSEVYSVTGEFDLVAMVRVRGHDELGDVIPGTVNKVAGVTHTETHIAFRTYSRHHLEAAFSPGYPASLSP